MIINIVRATVPTTSQPNYIVDGVTQSHWLAENSVTSGSTITSVTDESGTEDLIQYSAGAVYEATGWGGDNGPAIYINTDVDGLSKLSANGWATRVSGTATPFTMTAKLQLLNSETLYVTPWGFSYNNDYPIHLAPVQYSAQTLIIRSYINSPSYWTAKEIRPPIEDGDRHNWYIEYDGINIRIWIDGVETSYYDSYSNGNDDNFIFNQFYIGYWGDTSPQASGVPAVMKLAEMHIYLTPAFDSTTRNILLNDLQNRRGT